MVLVWFGIFWLMQAGAQVIFKWGSLHPPAYTLGFIGGNIVGASSIWFLMQIYKSMNPCLALGLASGGGFLMAQFALQLFFRQGISPMQYAAMTLIAAGMMMFVMGARAAA